MKAEVTTALEFGTDRPCQIGRIVYREGICTYVALAFRYLDGPAPSRWELTWVGPEGGDTARLPKGVLPSASMVNALDEAAE